MAPIRTAGLFLAAILCAWPAAAQAPHPPAAQPATKPPAKPQAKPASKSVELRINLPLDLGITLGAGAIWLTTELLTDQLAPSDCRWCDRNADGSNGLNGFDSSLRSALRWKHLGTARTLSDVFSLVLAPSVGTGIGALVTWHDDRLDELPEDILLVAEAAMLAGTVTQLAKFTVGRERPYVHIRSPSERVRLRSSADNLSFFSGHAALAFALATSAGTVASMRRYSLAPVMWAAGLTFATTGAYLRIAADRHYASDVLVGTLTGAAIGFAVPYFAHPPLGLRVGALVHDNARGLVVSGSW
jgi:membrane-associated phospholipid phosphatase